MQLTKITKYCVLGLFFSLSFIKPALSGEAEDILNKHGANTYPKWISNSSLAQGLKIEQAELYRGDAKSYIETGRYNRGRILLYRIIADSKATVADWQLLSQAGIKTDSKNTWKLVNAEAAYAYSHIALNSSEKSEFLLIMADAFIKLGQSSKAIILWEKALSLNNNSARTLALQKYKNKLNAKSSQSKKVKIAKIQKLGTRSFPDKVSLCTRFESYKPNIENHSLDYRKYFKLEPAHNFKTRVEYGNICLDNLQPATSYTVTIDSLLPISDTYKLDMSYVLSATTLDYEADFKFKESSYILAKKGQNSVPITSVNIDELELKLIYINDRNLLPSINKFAMRKNIRLKDQQSYIEKNGDLIWSRLFKLNAPQKNKRTITAVPLEKLIQQPGLYVLTAQKPDNDTYDYASIETQWLVVSDTGLLTLEAADYLHIFSHELFAAKNQTNIEISLLSRANEILATTVTDVDGYAKIPANLLKGQGGKTPKLLLAYSKNGDFGLLDISRPEHDFSDRGVSGRKSPGLVDVFLYSNRDLFKPGETIKIHGLIKDQSAKAIANLQVKLKLINPEQKEISSASLKSDESGYISWESAIDPNAITGSWQIEIYAGSKQIVGEYGFLLEDFVPPKIKAKISSKTPSVIPQQEFNLLVESEFLHGAPLSGANANLDIAIIKSKIPFANYADFVFGDFKDDWNGDRIELSKSEFVTDKNGMVNIPIKDLTKMYKTTHPLSANINVAVTEPGGRPFNSGLKLLYQNQATYIGLKPAFDNDSIDEGSKATFQLIHLDNNSKIKPATLNYVLTEETENGYWTQSDGQWQYQESYSDGRKIASGTIEISTDESNTLKLDKLTWGTYRLDVTTDDGIHTSYRFSSGNTEVAGRSIADKLKISSDKTDYKSGDKVRLSVLPKNTGPILITVVNHGLIYKKQLDGKAGKASEFTLQTDDSWGLGAYIIATSFHKTAKDAKPNRSIGLVYVKILDDDAKIPLQISHVAKTESGTKLDIELSAKSQQDTYVTVSLVDEGILNLTSYTSPDPFDWYTGQLSLGAKLRDIYGNLITPQGTLGEFRVGGDEEYDLADTGQASQSLRKIVALFTDKIKFDENGKAHVSFDIPQYQGALKVMAVAWSKDAVGSATSNVIVKDKISLEYYTPRFLATEDTAETLLTVNFDKSAANSDYQIEIMANDVLQSDNIKRTISVTDNPTSRSFKQTLKLRAIKAGVGTIKVKVLQKDKLISERSWDLAVRSKYAKRSILRSGIFAPDKSLLSRNLVTDNQYHLASDIKLKISGAPALGAKAMSLSLMDYAHRCAEQTTSRAFPALSIAKNSDSEKLINNAISRLLTYQNSDGGFGLWQDDDSGLWISAFVMGFLLNAQKANYLINNKVLAQGLKYLENNLDRWNNSKSIQESNAYALYALSLGGRNLISDVNYHIQNKNSKIESPLAWAQLAAVLARVGNQESAIATFNLAKVALNYKVDYYNNYGGYLRDLAAITLLAKQAKVGMIWDKNYLELANVISKRDYFSTQEMSWVLRLARTTASPSAVFSLNINTENKQLESFTNNYLKFKDIPLIKNTNAHNLWYTLKLKSAPTLAELKAQKNNGFTIKREFYKLDGTLADLNNIKPNERLIVVINGTIDNLSVGEPLIVDVIAAGFEIENPAFSNVDLASSIKWLDNLTKTRFVAYRDDRFIGAINTSDISKQREFKLAYAVRAVTKGQYNLSAVSIEDMYQPWLRAIDHDNLGKTLNISDNAQITNNKSLEPILLAQRGITDLRQLDYDLVNSNELSVNQLAEFSVVQLNTLRNSIFAQAGLDFSSSKPTLHQAFSKFTWYKPQTLKSGMIYKNLGQQKQDNIQLLLATEKGRLGNLSLSDFYRVKVRGLNNNDINSYNKSQMQILRNSLFARHGLSFAHKSQLAKIFQQMPWYQPNSLTVSSIYDNIMSELEKDNVQLFLQKEKNF